MVFRGQNLGAQDLLLGPEFILIPSLQSEQDRVLFHCFNTFTSYFYTGVCALHGNTYTNRQRRNLNPAQHFRQGGEPGTFRGASPGGKGSLEKVSGRPSGLGMRGTACGVNSPVPADSSKPGQRRAAGGGSCRSQGRCFVSDLPRTPQSAPTATTPTRAPPTRGPRPRGRNLVGTRAATAEPSPRDLT